MSRSAALRNARLCTLPSSGRVIVGCVEGHSWADLQGLSRGDEITHLDWIGEWFSAVELGDERFFLAAAKRPLRLWVQLHRAPEVSRGVIQQPGQRWSDLSAADRLSLEWELCTLAPALRPSTPSLAAPLASPVLPTGFVVSESSDLDPPAALLQNRSLQTGAAHAEAAFGSASPTAGWDDAGRPRTTGLSNAVEGTADRAPGAAASQAEMSYAFNLLVRQCPMDRSVTTEEALTHRVETVPFVAAAPPAPPPPARSSLPGTGPTARVTVQELGGFGRNKDMSGHFVVARILDPAEGVVGVIKTAQCDSSGVWQQSHDIVLPKDKLEVLEFSLRLYRPGILEPVSVGYKSSCLLRVVDGTHSWQMSPSEACVVFCVGFG
mmetsp:Transcript_107124/g.245230  ORF Transcript_107124/g.245230 Transcript_107124/m.245230 type:complete len:379 (+) Transcript_107124:474-1610(+)